ncbi:endonuclease I [uncultured Caudovirales phage]|uniref:Endonuclease I n=1 Tax=uncultured Caudovirales phage TaxID=2100421 RepID=A0A6J5M2J9_9CAUD|nr:endonuclease I [uncultured Caudovirales phage]
MEGFRSGLEEKIADQLRSAGIEPAFEVVKIPFTKPEKVHHYTADFLLPNGIVVESKGRFVVADRQKHIFVKGQHPKLDLRFVFSNPNARISKTSPTTYAMWCQKNGFLYAAKLVPQAWLAEPYCSVRATAALAFVKAPRK